MTAQIRRAIDHGLIFIDTGADQNFPIDTSEDGELWNQGNVQVAMPLVSQCCKAMTVDHYGELYCTCCGDNLTTHQQSPEVTNIISN